MKMDEESALNKLFFRKLQLFTRQNVKMILYYDASPIPIKTNPSNETRYIVDDEHNLWKDYPAYRWFGRIIADCFAACLNIEHLTKENLSVAFGQFEQEVEHSIGNNLRTLFGDLDFSLITAISCEKYEKSVGNGLCAIIIPSEIDKLNLKAYGFSRFNSIKCDSLEYANIHGLRKLLNMTSAADSCLVFGKMHGKYHALGLASREACTQMFPHILFTGHAEWELHFPTTKENAAVSKSDSGYSESCRIKYSVGKFILPAVNTSSGEIKLIRRLLPAADGASIVKMISNLKELGSGSIVIVGEDSFIDNEVKRLCKDAELGIAFVKSDGYKRIRCSDSQHDLRQIVSIDGAVFVDYRTDCHAFGVILDGTVNPGSGSSELMGNISRGSRFNSANNYVNSKLRTDPAQQGKLIGMVTSDDGMFDIFPASRDEDTLTDDVIFDAICAPWDRAKQNQQKNT